MKYVLVILAISTIGCSQKSEYDPGSFVVLLDSAPKGIDPRFATSDGSAKLVGLLHAGLVSTDTKDGNAELELAESIETKSDLEYVIRLKKGLTFHDGQPLTSHDVKYTFMQLGSELVKSPYAGTARRIEKFDIVDDLNFQITLKKPHAPFMTDLGFGIVPKHICDGHKECPGNPVGAGPFAYVRETDDGIYQFKAFDNYIGGKPKIDRVAFRVVKDDNTRLLALLGNTANMVQNAVAPLMLPVVADNDRLVVQSEPSFKYTYIGINLEHEILGKLKVRKALAHGIDRQSIIDYKFRGKARLSTGMIAPNHWSYNANVEKFPYDPARAKILLDEAGYPDPDGDGPKMRFELEFKVSSNKFRRALATLIAQQLKEIGIGITVRAYEWGTFFSDIKSRNFALTTLQWPSVLEPSLYRWVFHSSNIPTPENRSAGANRGAYRNETVDKLLDQGNVETDPDKRRAIYMEVQAILAAELPYISMWHEDNIAIVKTGTEDYYITPNARFEALKTARFNGNTP